MRVIHFLTSGSCFQGLSFELMSFLILWKALHSVLWGSYSFRGFNGLISLKLISTIVVSCSTFWLSMPFPDFCVETVGFMYFLNALLLSIWIPRSLRAGNKFWEFINNRNLLWIPDKARVTIRNISFRTILFLKSIHIELVEFSMRLINQAMLLV